MKFSLLTLLGIVAVVAVACAALTNPVQGWVTALVTTSILLLFGAVLFAIDCRGATRAFWRGFAIFGWGYSVLLWVGLGSELNPDRSAPRLLATTWALDELAEASLDRETSLTITYEVYTDLARRAGTTRQTGSVTEMLGRRHTGPKAQQVLGPPETKAWRCLLRIGHTLWALVFAFVGGSLAKWLYLRRERRL
ncbi:MAG: hypothetical protein WD645_06125 [Dehalococcoidia bacterium]